MGYDGAARRVYQNKTIHGTKKDAESYLAEAIRQRDLTGTDSAAQRTLMRELFTDLLADYRVNNKGVKWAEQKIRLHLEPAFGETRVRNLTTTLVRQYVHERQKSEAANATINRELAVLKRALNLGRRHTAPKFPSSGVPAGSDFRVLHRLPSGRNPLSSLEPGGSGRRRSSAGSGNHEE